uniref:Truncated verticillium wilt resistance-like protein n=1 Tax=Rhizophora mucronata TaxID=61149 RepID=A0A2P2MJL7_RHIMU
MSEERASDENLVKNPEDIHYWTSRESPVLVPEIICVEMFPSACKWTSPNQSTWRNLQRILGQRWTIRYHPNELPRETEALQGKDEWGLKENS